MIEGEAFENSADGEVVFAGEIESGEELGAAVAWEGGGGESLGANKSVGNEDSQVPMRS